MSVTNEDIMQELQKMRKSTFISSILTFGFSIMAVGTAMYYAMAENEKIYVYVLLILGLASIGFGFLLAVFKK